MKKFFISISIFSFVCSFALANFALANDHPPNIPYNPTPQDNASDQKTVTVFWSGGDPDKDEVVYTVYWSYGPDFYKIFKGETKDTSYTFGNWKKFPYDKIFRWKVMADDGKFQVAGPNWRFDTYSDIRSRPIFFPNYPNPFNPTTTISYQLSITSNVELDIYNLTGQKVTTLVSEEQPAGDYKYEWNGNEFASGVYIYRLKAGEFIQTKKMFLLK